MSVVTVSKVLRNQGRISDATRKRVLRHAKKLELSDELGGAQPGNAAHLYDRLAAAGVRASVLCRDCPRGGANRAPHGYHVVISSFEEDPELEASEVDCLLARQVDGLIIASAQSSRAAGNVQASAGAKNSLCFDRPSHSWCAGLFCGGG